MESYKSWRVTRKRRVTSNMESYIQFGELKRGLATEGLHISELLSQVTFRCCNIGELFTWLTPRNLWIGELSSQLTLQSIWIGELSSWLNLHKMSVESCPNLDTYEIVSTSQYCKWIGQSLNSLKFIQIKSSPLHASLSKKFQKI